MKPMTRDTLSVLLLGLLSGCEKDAIRAEKPADSAGQAAPAVQAASSAKSVGASEVTPEGSAKAKAAEKTCAPGGCAAGKCGGSK